jgi:hypothetical protein
MEYSIYELVDSRFPDVCLYVGRTKNSLNARLCNHKAPGNLRSISSYPDKSYVIIRLLERCPERVRTQREFHWIETLNPRYNFKPLRIDENAPRVPIPRYDRLRSYDEIYFGVPWVERPREFQTPRFS